MAELLSVENLSAGYGEARVIQDLRFTLEDGRSLALLGRNGVGKTTLIDTLIGVTTRFGGRIVLAGRGHRCPPAACARPPWRRLDPAGAQHIPFADGRGEPDRGRAVRPVDAEAGLCPLSRASRSGEPTWDANCRAENSRCSRSAAR